VYNFAANRRREKFEKLSRWRGDGLKELSVILKKAWAIGWKTALATLLPLIVGFCLGAAFHVKLWLTLAGLGVGVIAGSAVIVRETLRAIENLAEQKRPQGDK